MNDLTFENRRFLEKLVILNNDALIERYPSSSGGVTTFEDGTEAKIYTPSNVVMALCPDDVFCDSELELKGISKDVIEASISTERMKETRKCCDKHFENCEQCWNKHIREITNAINAKKFD